MPNPVLSMIFFLITYMCQWWIQGKANEVVSPGPSFSEMLCGPLF